MADVTPAGAGGLLGPVAPEPDGYLRVRGGVGGIRFQFEELMEGSVQLDGLAGELGAIEAEVRAVGNALRPYQYDAPASGRAAVDAVEEGTRGVQQVREQLEHMSSQVKASYRDYLAAESRAGQGFAPDVLVPLKHPRFPGLNPTAVHVLEERTREEPVDLTLAGVLARAGRLHEEGDGRIEVIAVDRGGQKTWLVVIPGTQRGHPPGGENPLDEVGIVEGLGYGSAEVGKAIHEALRLAGAQAGEGVAAVGHSQGGIHAMNLARDPDFLADYDLKFVLTAGSPAGGIMPAPGIKTLHLEHELDWVPLADGTRSPDTRDRVTVTLANPVSLPPGEDFGLGPGHRLSNYAAAAEAVSASSNPSLRESTGAFAAVAGSGGSAMVTRFTLRRAPVPQVPALPAFPPVTSARRESGPPTARPP
jgi:hypothetical protein